jgi:hypothetical protein
VILAALTLVALIGCGDGGGTTVGDTSMAISDDSSFHATVSVGRITDFDFTIKDVGTVDIPSLDIMFDGGDKFLDHYTVIKAGPCKVDKDLPGLACGLLAQGKELKFNMTAQPRTAGNFTFKYHIANDGRYLNEADGKGYTYSWTQTILS